MTRLISFALDYPGLVPFGFVLQRDTLPCNGDLECGFFDGITNLHRHPANAPIGLVLKQVAMACETVVVIRNPDLVLDSGLRDAVIATADSLAPVAPWALAGAGGLGLHDRRHLALYASESPAIPENAGLQPLIDVMPDIYLIHAELLYGVPDEMLCGLHHALEPALVTKGYLEGRVSVFTPTLAAGINGDLLARDLAGLKTELSRCFEEKLPNQTIETLSGPVSIAGGQMHSASAILPVDLEDTMHRVVADRSDQASISILTRTRFDRMHLLRRMLTSVSRARDPSMPTEVILSTDAAPNVAEQVFTELQAEFVNLKLRLKLNHAGGYSRIANMLGGIDAAAGEYLLFLDDDDYLDIFAFDAMRGATFAGNRPVIALTSTVQEEIWVATPSGRWVLSHSARRSSYPASGWRDMFSGVNRMPICGMIFTRSRVNARLKSIKLRHDLSEDYALFLLMLTDPLLSGIHECPQPAVHISIRDSENSVLMTDRRPWVRDITRFLADLTQPSAATGPGQWMLNCRAAPEFPRPEAESALASLQLQLDRRDREIRMLRQQVRCLQEQPDAFGKTAA